MATKQVVNSGSVQSSTGTGAGSASSTGLTAPPSTAKPARGLENTLEQLLAGFTSIIPVGFTFASTSGGYSQATVVAQLQQTLALYTASESAKQAASQAVAAVRAAAPGAEAYAKALKDALIGYFGRGAPQLAQFGITSKTKAKPTSLQNAVRAAKAKQTRDQKGTLGKKQKAQAAFQQQLQSMASVLIPQGTGTAAPAAATPAAPASQAVKQS